MACHYAKSRAVTIYQPVPIWRFARTWWRNWQQDMSETLDGFSAGCIVRCSTTGFGRSDIEWMENSFVNGQKALRISLTSSWQVGDKNIKR